jgi:ribonuclease D
MDIRKELPIEYVDDQQKLQNCEKHLSKTPAFSFDLEFDNNHFSYGITLCLIQISTADRCFVIDTLQPLDLSDLFRVFENKSILKICFSPDQDLKLLRSLNCRPQNIFDVAVAGKLLNEPASGLGAILESRLQVSVNKKFQKSNWGKRPLSEEQIKYSSDDVIHLIRLKEVFEKEAQQKGILPWLREENESLDSFEEETKSADDFLTRKDREAFSDHTLYALNELLRYAHALGKRINKPVGWLINKQLLVDLIRNRLSIDELPTIRGIHPTFKDPDFKSLFLKTIEAADSKNLSKRSHNPKPGFEQQREMYRQKSLAEVVRANTFYPIKKVIAERYGEFASDFIFGDSQISPLIKGKTKIPDLKMKYRIDLISSIGSELGIDLSAYRRP